jgi:microcystin-dependent protein
MTSFGSRHHILGSKKDYVGDIKFTNRDDDHFGWLKCDGRSLNKNTYSDLFSIIGYSFGGSGNTFSLPNPNGRVLGSTGSGSGLTSRSMGDLSGSETHTLTESQMTEHTHTLSNNGAHTHTINDSGHRHDVDIGSANDLSGSPNNDPVADGDDFIRSKTTNSSLTGISIDSGGLHTHTASNTGSGEAFNIIQPTIFVGNLFIYSGLRLIGTRPHEGQLNN